MSAICHGQAQEVKQHSAGQRLSDVAHRPAQGARIVDRPFPRRTVIEVINGVRRNSGSSDDPISHFELRKGGQIWTASCRRDGWSQLGKSLVSNLLLPQQRSVQRILRTLFGVEAQFGFQFPSANCLRIREVLL